MTETDMPTLKIAIPHSLTQNEAVERLKSHIVNTPGIMAPQ